MMPIAHGALVRIAPLVALLGATMAVVLWRMSEKAPAAGLASIEARLAAVAAQPDSTTGQLSELARRQRVLAEALIALEARLDQAVRSDRSAKPTLSLSVPPTQQDLDQQDALIEEQIRQRMFELDVKFSAEPMDPAWSVAATATIRGVAQWPEHAASTITHLDCRSTMCRIQAEHESPKALAAFTLGLPIGLQWNYTMALRVAENADGTQSSTMFVSRDGHDLHH